MFRRGRVAPVPAALQHLHGVAERLVDLLRLLLQLLAGFVQPVLQRLLDEYYGLRGWDKEGRPTKATLQKLGIKA